MSIKTFGRGAFELIVLCGRAIGDFYGFIGCRIEQQFKTAGPDCMES
jgi:hypothetical protein